MQRREPAAERRRFECRSCLFRLIADGARPTCPRCGDEMTSLLDRR